MPLTNPALNIAADCITAQADFVSLHDGDPGSTGANEIVGVARVASAWSAAVGSGDSATGPHLFTGGGSNDPVTHFGLWTLAAGGVFVGGGALTGDQQFNSAGEYTVLQVALDGGACP